MIAAVRRVLQNSFFNLVASVAQRLGQTVIFIVIARLLSDSDVGAYKLANTYGSVILALTFWGIDQLFIRELSRRRDDVLLELGRFLVMRVLVTLLFLLLLAVVLPFLPYSPATRQLILVMSLSLVPGAVASLYQSVWIALEDVGRISLLMALVSIVRMAGGLAIVWLDRPLLAIAWWFLAVSVLEMVVDIWMTHRRLNLGRVRPALAPRLWWALFQESLPLMILALVLTVEQQFDVIVLSFFRPEAEVGVYGLALTVLTLFLFLTRSFQLAIFPVLARAHREGMARLRRVYRLTFYFTLLGGLIIALAASLASSPLMRLFYGPGNDEAVTIFRVLAWVFAIAAFNIPNSRLMIAIERQKITAYFALASLTGNILVSLWLVPRYGGLGTAWAKLLTMPLYSIPCALYVYRFLRQEKNPT